MFEYVTDKLAQNKKLVFTILPFIPVLLILVNFYTLESFLVGLPLLFMYLLVNGEILGRAFFGDESHFFRLMFGLFTFIALMAVTGLLAAVASRLEIWYLLGLVFAAAVSSFLNLILVKYDKAKVKSSIDLRAFLKGSRFSVLYLFYVVLFALSFLMLFNERSGWVLARPSIWAVIPPTFLRLYFFATALLVGIALLPGKLSVKLLLIALHSTLTLSFVPIMVYPGVISLEAWYDLGRARVVFDVVRSLYELPSFGLVSLARAMNSFLKGASVQVLAVSFAGATNIDMYWSDVLLVPILWGSLVPLTTYKLTEMIGAGKRASIFAALVTLPNFYFLAWGKLSISDSLGNLFFFLWLYLLLRFLGSYKIKMLFPMLVTLAAITATHFLPLLVAVSFAVMAFALKMYERLRLRYSNIAKILLFLSFVLSVFLLPIGIIGRGIAIPALGESAFSINRLLGTSLWSLVLGLDENVPVQQGLLYFLLFPLLALVGFAYTLQRKTEFNKASCFFLFLAFGISMLDYRILQYALEGGLFGAGRVNFFRDVAILPFAGLTVELVVKFVFDTAEKARSILNFKNITAATLICIGFSSWVVLMVYDNYTLYTWGLIGTSLEVEAIKYIDQSTNRYVVFAPGDTTGIAWGFIGYPFPPGKLYVETSKVPSVNDMYLQMKGVEADVGYFMAPSFRFGLADFDKVVSKASRLFGLFKVLSSDLGDIYIFEYKIPPLPTSPDVMAFFWSTPSTYYIQNNLMRIIINPATKSLNVEDFWGGLFESIELNDTSVGGYQLGSLRSLEYFDDANNRWLEWTSDANIPSADQFQFRLIFENDSLVGLVGKGEGFVQLQWESGRESSLSLGVGDFKRLYIPGLVGGKGSYDVMSKEFGFLYTLSLTDGVVLHPAYNALVNTTYLTYSEIVKDCGFNLTASSMSYDLYVHNNASVGQWAYVEVWLPNEVYTGTWPPFSFSLDDGKTWVYAPYNVEVETSVPVTTIGGAEVNWIFSVPAFRWQKPVDFRSYFSPVAQGGVGSLPENYTDSGGAPKRIIFGLYLPAKDKALLRLGSSAYEPRPFEVDYVFRDSDNIAYGLRNMKEGFIKLYNLGTSEYVGGITFTNLPTSLIITQYETGVIKFIRMEVPSNTTLSFLSRKEVDTTVDQNEDGIPDSI